MKCCGIWLRSETASCEYAAKVRLEYGIEADRLASLIFGIGSPVTAIGGTRSSCSVKFHHEIILATHGAPVPCWMTLGLCHICVKTGVRCT